MPVWGKIHNLLDQSPTEREDLGESRCLTLVMAVAQLSPASSISWSTLKPYSLKSSSSMCWASSCLQNSQSAVKIVFTVCIWNSH